MKYSNESEISIRQMQCFLAVAEQSSFSRAALQLNMGQSTLSKCVSMLERTPWAEALSAGAASHLSDACRRGALSTLEQSGGGLCCVFGCCL